MKLNRKTGLLLLAAATLGAGAVVATAATATATGTAATTTATTGRHWHHRHGGMLVGTMLRATRQLNLSADQQAQIKGILSSARNQHSGAAPAADMTVLGNPGDPNYAAALEGARSQASSRLQREIELQGQIYNVLTPEQKSKLPQVLAAMKTKAEQRRAAWQQQHAASSNGASGSN